MGIERVTILGISAPTLTMISDGLESNGLFPVLRIINNLGLDNLAPYENPRFTFEMSDSLRDVSDAPYFLGTAKSVNKMAVFNFFKRDRSDFINIIHKTSSISSTVQLGTGVLVNSLVSVAGFAQIGDFVTINRNASVGHHTILEDFVTINPGANVAGFVRIGRKTVIGMGANVIDGISIGENTIVGAGSLVTKNLPDGVVAYGNPCVIVRKNET